MSKAKVKRKKGKPLTEKEIKHVHNIYMRTLSCAMTAKVCGCSATTVARLRRNRGWIAEKPKIGTQTGSGNVSLTSDIAIKLAAGWKVHVEDADLCDIVGVTQGQLDWWLEHNTPVTIIRNVLQVGSDGRPLYDAQGNQKITQQKEKVGLHDLRKREWANFEQNYMTKLAMLAQRAENEGDLRTSANIVMWMLQKRFPKKFGKQANGDVNVNVTKNELTNVLRIDTLNLPLKTRVELLDALEAAESNGN